MNSSLLSSILHAKLQSGETGSSIGVLAVSGPQAGGAGRRRKRVREPGGASCEGLRGRVLRQPRAVVAEQGVEEGEQLARDGDEGHYRFAALDAEALV